MAGSYSRLASAIVPPADAFSKGLADRRPNEDFRQLAAGRKK
jgi:hypothetical protein